MGTYLNPGNIGFKRIRARNYVDKTGLIAVLNDLIDTTENLICVSRPRRFGKSFATQTLCAYYDKTCDSDDLFDGLKIKDDPSYHTHLNKYNIIYLDMTNIKAKTSPQNFVSFLTSVLVEELHAAFPSVDMGSSLDQLMLNIIKADGSTFIMIIDEWDAPIREMPSIQREYLDFLRMLVKSSGTTAKLFAAVYMTGILPIKRDGSQSAISDFREYTIISPGKFGEYVGFTESEVKTLCDVHHIDFAKMKEWYDGYTIDNVGSVYNPNSVIRCIEDDRFDSYWTQSSGVIGLINLINMDFDGLLESVAILTGGGVLKVDTVGFLNDPYECTDKNDVLTLLIHYGYLAYNSEEHTVRIPNSEILSEFSRAFRKTQNKTAILRLRESEQLIDNILELNEEAVAIQIEKIHNEQSRRYYNNEQALRSVIKLALFSVCNDYIMFEEFPSGDGYVDIAYLPKPLTSLPAIVIELKWNKTVSEAIQQIRDRDYPEKLRPFANNIILVGISYDKNAPIGQRKHTCIIEQA